MLYVLKKRVSDFGWECTGDDGNTHILHFPGFRYPGMEKRPPIRGDVIDINKGKVKIIKAGE